MTTSPRWRVALASAASAAALVAGPLVGAQIAHAQDPPTYPTTHHPMAPYPPQPGELTLSATTVRAGGTVSFTATGFAARQRVTALLESHPIVLGRFQADDDGTAEGTVTIPRRVRPGWHTFKVTARGSGRCLSTRIKVLPAHGKPGHNGSHGTPGHDDHRGNLANTGSERALASSEIAAGLIAAGGGTMLTVRRRRRS
jgi:hypothetical protein